MTDGNRYSEPVGGLEMRYVLWLDHTVSLGARDEASKYMVGLGAGRQSWQAAVSHLTTLVRTRREGKITHLEISSHGEQAEIHASAGGYITHENVTQFGAMLKPIMARGALIEILCCKVADIASQAWKMLEIQPNQYKPAVLNAYLAGWEQAPYALDENNKPVLLTGWPLQHHKEIILTIRGQVIKPEYDGLGFCLKLAAASGAVVRAARLSQVEELNDEKHRPIMRDYDTIGDWEGPVWDFMPNGEVKYLGANVARHKATFPTQLIGPRLTYSQSDQDQPGSDVNQRRQRMNRSPLPV